MGKALVEDLVSWCLPGSSTLSSVGRALLGRLGFRGPPFERSFLRRDLRELSELYSAEEFWMVLPNGDDYRRVPLVMAADWTRGRGLVAKVTVALSSDQLELDSSILGLTEPALQAYLCLLRNRDRKPPSDDLNLRIAKWTEIDGKTRITLQPVSYFTHIRTNLTMDYIHVTGGFSLRQKVHANRRLEPLGQTSLADHLGIDILLFSVDGQLILARRSREVAVAAGKLGPAGAGALQASDFPVRCDTVALSDLHLLRELFEETGLRASDINLDQVDILGVGRDLLRGGKPHLFLRVSSLLTSDKILERLDSAKSSYEARELVSIPLGRFALNEHLSQEELRTLRASVSSVVARYSEEMTEPLLGALAMWWRAREVAALT